MKRWKPFWMIMLLAGITGAEVTISNLAVAQREGTKLVDISYDVSCDWKSVVSVSLSVSNGAEAVSASSLSGHIGDVLVGTGKNMVWDMGADWNGEFSSAMAFSLVVSDETPQPSMVAIPAGTNSGTDPDSGAYSLTVDALSMNKYEVTNQEMMEVLQWAYDNSKLTVSTSSVQNALGDTQPLLDLGSSHCRITWSGSAFGVKSEKGVGFPCVEVTWYGAAAYCNYLSEKEGKTPCYNLSDWSCNVSENGYRLPTGEEWEYAARGGLSSKRFPWGDSALHSDANYYGYTGYSYDSSSGYHSTYDAEWPQTSPCGAFLPNGYGLCDMAGNVWEWCNDSNGSGRMVRGGSWRDSAFYARCGHVPEHRPGRSYDCYGFRTVRR